MGGKLRMLPSSVIGLLTTDVLSWRAKLALAFERFQSNKQNLPMNPFTLLPKEE